MEDVEVHIEGEEEEQTTTKTNGKSKKEDTRRNGECIPTWDAKNS